MTLTAAIASSLIYATDVYLLLFLAILCGVLFANLARVIGRLLPLPYGANLTVVVATSVAILAGTVFFFGWRIDHQLQQTSEQLDHSYDEVTRWLEKSPTAKTVFGRVPFSEEFMTENAFSAIDGERDNRGHGNRNHDDTQGEGSENAEDDAIDSASAGWANVGTVKSVSGRVFGVLGKLFSTTLGVTMNFAFVFFVGVFLATKPHYYRDNFAKLFPKSKRSRVVEILDKLGQTLFDWLQGRAATMLITGCGTSLMLWVLGVPLALTLGIITGILTFIPTIGGFIALILSMLVAFSQGPVTVVWVIVLYGVLQFIESNIITPLIQQHQTSVPPPVLLTSQLMMGVLTGFLGVMVSTPLAASLIVLVREAYVIDVLGDDSNE